MMGMEDPTELANQRPFDQAFINAMIPHHESAIEMAQVAFAGSAYPTIRDPAGRIVDGQTSEIEQMWGWLEEWYPGG